MTIAQQLSRNITATGIGLLVRVVLAFLVIPILTSYLGAEKYGIWAIVFQLLTFLGLADIGIDKALARQIARQSAQPNWEVLSGTIASALPITFLLGALPIVISLFLGSYLFDSFEMINSTNMLQGTTALITVSIYIGFRIALLPVTTVLGGMQRQDLVSRWDIAEEIGRAVALLILVYNRVELPGLAFGVLAVGLLRQTGAVWQVKRLYPELQMFRPGSQPGELRALLGYSSISLGITVAWMVLFNSDAIILGLLGSVVAAGVYMPAVQLMLYLRHLVNIVGVPLTPAVAQLDGRGERARIAEWYSRWSRAVTYLAFSSAIATSLYAHHFVTLWLPSDFAETANAMAILAVGNAFFMPSIIGNAVLFGTAKHRFLLWIVVSEVVVRLALAAYLVPRSGAVGLAMATTASQLLLYSLPYPLLVCRALGVEFRPVLSHFLAGAFWGAVVALPCGLLMIWLIAPDTWPIFVLHVVAVTSVIMYAGWRIALDKDDRAVVLSSLKAKSSS